MRNLKSFLHKLARFIPRGGGCLKIVWGNLIRDSNAESGLKQRRSIAGLAMERLFTGPIAG
jgi:hypothetical protein